jgi:hypothetical protein
LTHFEAWVRLEDGTALIEMMLAQLKSCNRLEVLGFKFAFYSEKHKAALRDLGPLVEKMALLALFRLEIIFRFPDESLDILESEVREIFPAFHQRAQLRVIVLEGMCIRVLMLFSLNGRNKD